MAKVYDSSNTRHLCDACLGTGIGTAGELPCYACRGTGVIDNREELDFDDEEFRNDPMYIESGLNG